MSQAVDPQAEYESLVREATLLMNKLLHNPKHYEATRIGRNREWGYLMVAAASAKTRLEFVVSPDSLVRQMLVKWKHLCDMIDTASLDDWRAAFDKQTIGQEIIAVLFETPDASSDPRLNVRGVLPERLVPYSTFDILVSIEPKKTPQDMLKVLLTPHVRRACCVQKVLAGKWASAIEAANWWRICLELGGAIPIDEYAKQAQRAFDNLSNTYVVFIETFSYMIDETDDADDYEVRCEEVRQKFTIDQTTYGRNLESARDRLYKVLRVKEQRESIFQ